MSSPFSTKTGQSLWEKASALIPGGNMLLSKHKNIYSPGLWPCYYSRCKGSKVWDLDDNEYIDFSSNGVGACSLGHAFEPIDSAVVQAIQKGVMSSLNSPIEVELAQLLVDLHPWADMARFARSGGEANAIAIRIARAYSGRDTVAICGYHGWHDWYLAANLDDDSSLDQHLLEGLSPVGVPKQLAGTIVPIRFNNFDDLELLKSGSIGVLKMEVTRNVPPLDNYLETIRQICNQYNIVLIFDECTTGFRQQYGGLHLSYSVKPDMAMFGKALGNGYAISAVIGKSSIMKMAVDSFISSTFWTESIGPTAAVATLKQMSLLSSWEKLPKLGSMVKDIWRHCACKYDLPITIQGIDALPTFTFDLPHFLAYKTVFTEQMLLAGFLASTSFYPTIAHTQAEIELYGYSVDRVFSSLSSTFYSGGSISSQCATIPCSPTFKRLN